MIEIKDVHRRFGSRPVLAGASWTFESGTVTYIEAPNGSGKTTLLRCLLGLVDCTGTITFDGRPRSMVRPSIAALFETPPVHPHLTGNQNLRVLSGPLADDGPLRRLLPDASLLRRRVAGYSSGERKRLALAGCLASAPAYVFLDEVDTGIDVDTLDVVAQLIDELRGRSTVILTGHNPDFYRHLADDVVELREGEIHREY
ncbi:MAG: ABC transporter ATP-binding protein [Propionibacteriaceae bacterium]|nr:ABC transporter ATP-binding protein [Propionibacteriaceae bacterium]